MDIDKKKFLAIAIASFAVFAMTFFALAASKNSNNIFLDSDQDGLTDQEEKMLGTDAKNPDTDGDGYTDGKEVKSGYNPLKPAPGDILIAQTKPQTATDAKTENTRGETEEKAASTTESVTDALLGEALSDLSEESRESSSLSEETTSEFLKLMEEKYDESGEIDLASALTSDDLASVTQNALANFDLAKELPEIKPEEMKVLPAIDGKNLSEEEVKQKQKEEVQKYLASLAFIFATNSPFAVDSMENFTTNLAKEQEVALTALSTGDKTKIEGYAEKARAGIEQIKKVEVPHVLQDIHKSALQLAIYSLDFKDKVVVDPADPMKNLAALASFQSVAESAMKLQSELTNVLKEYGIAEVELP